MSLDRMEDMTGVPVETGDYLTDSRGRSYQILPTFSTLQKSRVAVCRPLKGKGEPVYVRLYSAIKIGEEDLNKTPTELRLDFEARATATSGPRREDLRQRRIEMDRKLREIGRRKY